VQEQRVVINFDDSGERQPLQRGQFETLYRRIQDSNDGFALNRLPADADPYPAVMSLHPRFEIDGDRGVLIEREGPTDTQLVDDDTSPDESERVEPDGLANWTAFFVKREIFDMDHRRFPASTSWF
jgi:hypothetical protein